MIIECGSQARVKYIEVSRVVESVGASVCMSIKKIIFHRYYSFSIEPSFLFNLCYVQNDFEKRNCTMNKPQNLRL